MNTNRLPLTSILYAMAAIGLAAFAANQPGMPVWAQDALTLAAFVYGLAAMLEGGAWAVDHFADTYDRIMVARSTTPHLLLYQAARGLTPEQLEALKELRIEGDILAWKENDRGEWAQNIQTEGGLVPLELAQRIIANSSDHHVSGERYVETGERQEWRWFVARMHYKGFCEEPGIPGKLTRWTAGGRASAAKWIGLGKVAPAQEDAATADEDVVRSFTVGSMEG